MQLWRLPALRHTQTNVRVVIIIILFFFPFLSFPPCTSQTRQLTIAAFPFSDCECCCSFPSNCQLRLLQLQLQSFWPTPFCLPLLASFHCSSRILATISGGEDDDRHHSIVVRLLSDTVLACACHFLVFFSSSLLL